MGRKGCCINGRLCYTEEVSMLIGYMRVSKSDGTQVFDLQRDALLAAGVNDKNIYEAYGIGQER
jgi:hypothetical protein